ncbi:MAG TPA: RraA family protein [Burkholderiaceae bacterium]|nr:RraA family protein [Burkholderiaceae bacterium]
MTDSNVDRASRLDTATLSDALDRHGIAGQCHRIRPCSPGFRMTGRAWTLRYGPAGLPAGTVGDYIDDVAPGSVIVLDNGGREDATVWGDILTEVAHRKGIAGTLIDGINRDVSLCLELGYPVYSRASWMRTGKDRVQVESTGEPVNIGQARVCPGDLIRGDADGVVVIPKEHEARVLETAEFIQQSEDLIRGAVRGGMSLREAREKYRYHQLQTRETR